MIRVRFSELALRDLESIASYIALDSDEVARRVVNRLEYLCFGLGIVPELGRVSEVEGVRKLVVPGWPYKILYTYHEKAQETMILRIYHAARDLSY